jgi:hypothetical protein
VCNVAWRQQLMPVGVLWNYIASKGGIKPSWHPLGIHCIIIYVDGLCQNNFPFVLKGMDEGLGSIPRRIPKRKLMLPMKNSLVLGNPNNM